MELKVPNHCSGFTSWSVHNTSSLNLGIVNTLKPLSHVIILSLEKNTFWKTWIEKIIWHSFIEHTASWNWVTIDIMNTINQTGCTLLLTLFGKSLWRLEIYKSLYWIHWRSVHNTTKHVWTYLLKNMLELKQRHTLVFFFDVMARSHAGKLSMKKNWQH